MTDDTEHRRPDTKAETLYDIWRQPGDPPYIHLSPSDRQRWNRLEAHCRARDVDDLMDAIEATIEAIVPNIDEIAKAVKTATADAIRASRPPEPEPGAELPIENP